MNSDIREVARRVTGYVRARQLMSNTDPEEISEIVIMPEGAEEPMPFRLLSSDLEALAAHAIGATPEEMPRTWPGPPRCEARVPDGSGTSRSGTRTCGLLLDEAGKCPRPAHQHASDGR